LGICYIVVVSSADGRHGHQPASPHSKPITPRIKYQTTFYAAPTGKKRSAEMEQETNYISHV
jgi:hypothetical protein